MSLSTDMSLMDILFDRDDPILKFGVEEKDLLKPDFDDLGIKGELLSDKIDAWNTNEDDFLNEILREEPFSMLNDKCNQENDIEMDYDWKTTNKKTIDLYSSKYSDSCSSNEPCLSPEYDEYEYSPVCDEDEIFSSAVSSISDSSNVNIELTEEQVEMDGSIFDVLDSNHAIHEENQAVLGILPGDMKQTEQNKTQKKKLKPVTKTLMATTKTTAPVLSSNSRSVLLPVITGNTVTTYKIVSSVNCIKTLKPINSMNNNNNPIIIKNMKPISVPMVIKNCKNVQNGKKFKTKTQLKQVIREREKETDEEDEFDEEEEEDDEITVISDSDEEKVKSQYPRLILSAEEKKLMLKEGVTLPTHYPLTKFEERELKRIRRKIRNKISAQDSRKRKKEYLDGLEDRVKQCTEENLSLVKKIKILQSQNQSLVVQLKKLQNSLSKTTTKTAQPATCLMVLLLSVALVMAPNLRLTQQNNENEVGDGDNSVVEKNIPPIGGRSRNLLFSKTTTPEECTEEDKLMNEMQEMLEFHNTDSVDDDVMVDNDDDRYYREKVKKRKTSLGEGSSGYETDYDNSHNFLVDHDYEPPPSRKRRRFSYNDQHNVYKFDSDEFGLSETEIPTDTITESNIVQAVQAVAKNLLFSNDDHVYKKPRELVVPDIDEEWIPQSKKLTEQIDELTTEVKVNISDSKGTRTVVIQVPKEKK